MNLCFENQNEENIDNKLLKFIISNSLKVIEIFNKKVIKILYNKNELIIKLTNYNEKQFYDILNHGNIINYLKYEKICDKYIILFFNFIEPCKNPIIDIVFLKQLLQTLEYIHFNNIIHCDIKPDNILINNNNVPIIIDFGIAQFSNTQSIMKRVGTLDYISPEIIELDSIGGMFSSKTDIWSFGITIYEYLFNNLPFYDDDESITAGKVLWSTINIPEHPFKFILEKCLDRNVITRYKASELLKLLNQ